MHCLVILQMGAVMEGRRGHSDMLETADTRIGEHTCLNLASEELSEMVSTGFVCLSILVLHCL